VVGEVAEPEERKVVALAKEIARLGSGTKTGAYEMSRTTNLLMTFAMRMPEFQTQLFRFVDVFPAMGDERDTARHLSEYFSKGSAPALVAAGVKVATTVPGGSRIASTLARREISRMASQFIVGTDSASASRELERLWRNNTATTIDLLGEHTLSHSEADRYAARLAEAIDRLLKDSRSWPASDRLERDDIGQLPRIAVSIKPSALAPDFRPLTEDSGIETAKERLAPILAESAEQGAQVWFDMERYETKHITHRLFQELLDTPELAGLNAGIVVQAYLEDSLADLEAIIEWGSSRPVPIAVRLVKGAYWDTETIVSEAAGWPVPVYGDKAATDLNFERCVRVLHAQHGKIRSAFGSHNLRSLAYAIESARLAGIPDNGYEIQLLHGMAEPIHEAIRQLGIRLRVYAPMGELVPGMAYLVRRLLENTSQNSFVRHRFAEGKDLEALLAKPVLKVDPGTDGGSSGAGANATATARSAASSASQRRGEPADYKPEPVGEWFVPAIRRKMSDAIRILGASTPTSAGTDQYEGAHRLGRLVPGRIAGEDLKTSRTIPSVNPADPSQIVAVSASASPADAIAAVEACAGAFGAWSRLSFEERAGVLFRAAAWMRERRFEIAALQVFEAGKCWDDADGDVCESIDYMEYYGRQAIRLGAGGEVQSPPGEVNTLTYRGRGVAVVIAPWNFPLAIPTGMVCGALVTGNTVVLKPAKQTPAVARVLVDALEYGGLPAGVLSFLPGIGEEIGDALVAHPEVATIAFTGSKPVGLQLNELAARVVPGQREVRRVFAEMGGKNALIIDADADLDVAVPAAVKSAFGYAGQKCSATSRIVVLEGIHDAFLDRFTEATRALQLGPPADMGTDMGPVIDEGALKRIRGWQEKAAEFGRVVLQRDDLPDKGYFVGPAIIDDVAPTSALAYEEIFGPVIAVLRAKDFDHAIEIANTSQYALTAGLISRSPSHIREAAESLRAGNIYINHGTTGAVVGRQPFGGSRMSGFGQKAGGPDYLYQFVEPRVVTENTIRQGFAPEE
jgi:RHH-type proline utilization regulon transcriptional repressor/proline dehydrogenase/delta 1-pyrroline-5-carboxylate dehydrogenase